MAAAIDIDAAVSPSVVAAAILIFRSQYANVQFRSLCANTPFPGNSSVAGQVFD
jgi:hypothetical protein